MHSHTATENICAHCGATLPPVHDAFCPECRCALEAPADNQTQPPPLISQSVVADPVSEMQEQRWVSWNVGERVLAPWESWFLYAGTIQQVSGDQAHIVFDDGDCGWVRMGQLHPLEIKAGRRVFGRWKMGQVFFPGQVVEVEGMSVRVLYDDGDEEWTKVAALRIACIPTGPDAYPTNIASGPGFFSMALGWLVPIGIVVGLALLRAGCR